MLNKLKFFTNKDFSFFLNILNRHFMYYIMHNIYTLRLQIFLYLCNLYHIFYVNYLLHKLFNRNLMTIKKG